MTTEAKTGFYCTNVFMYNGEHWATSIKRDGARVCRVFGQTKQECRDTAAVLVKALNLSIATELVFPLKPAPQPPQQQATIAKAAAHLCLCIPPDEACSVCRPELFNGVTAEPARPSPDSSDDKAAVEELVEALRGIVVDTLEPNHREQPYYPCPPTVSMTNWDRAIAQLRKHKALQ